MACCNNNTTSLCNSTCNSCNNTCGCNGWSNDLWLWIIIIAVIIILFTIG